MQDLKKMSLKDLVIAAERALTVASERSPFLLGKGNELDLLKATKLIQDIAKGLK